MIYLVSQCYMWFSPNLVWFGFVWLVCHHHRNQVCLYYDSAKFAWVCFFPWPPGLVGGDKFCLGRWSAWTFWHLGHLHHCCYHNQYCYDGHNYWWHVQFTSSSSLCLLMVTLINGVNQVGCYCWLDKLGMAARYRVTTVIRQAGVFLLFVCSIISIISY